MVGRELSVRRHFVAKLIFASLFSILRCVSPLAQTSISVRPEKLHFGDHDIGTSSPQTLSATNTGDGTISLTVRIIGPDPGDTPAEFSWSSK